MKIKHLSLAIILPMICIFATEPQYFSSSDHFSNNSYIRNAMINNDRKIKNVILFIGDGMGPNHVSAAEILKGSSLSFTNKNDLNWSLNGYQNTDSLTSNGFTLDTTKSLLRPELNGTLYDNSDSPYGSGGNYLSNTCFTDSAAGGTALSTGRKTNNSYIAMGPTGEEYETILEIAHSLNKKTGVVTTDKMTGATPSSFLTHIDQRHKTDEILTLDAESEANLIIAEKPSNWKDTHDTLYANNGWHIAKNISETSINSEKEVVLLDNLLSNSSLTPSLEDLTAYSLDKLDNEEGFFLMIESSEIDTASHENQIGTTLQAVLEFERSIEVATRWAEPRNDTLIVVTADHETGAIYYNRNTTTQANIYDNVKFLSKNHSRTRVPFYVWGDVTSFTSTYNDLLTKQGKIDEGMETESSIYWQNTDIFKLCVSYL